MSQSFCCSALILSYLPSTDKEHLAAVLDPQGVSRAAGAAGRFPGARASPRSGPRALREIGSATRRNSGQPAPWQQPSMWWWFTSADGFTSVSTFI